MRIWFVELGEPLPFQHEQRLLRYGELTGILAERGHQVTWWACDFSHQTKSYIGEPNTRVSIGGIDIVLVHGTGYRRNVGLGRIRHLRSHARNLSQLISDEPPPDIIVSAMPSIEACEVVVSYAQAHRVPVVVDIRDEWPEDYVRWLPELFRPAARLALRGAFASLAKVCRDASALTAVSEKQLDYGIAVAQRSRRPTDAVFHTGARDEKIPHDRLVQAVAQWRQRGLGEERFVCSFSGTMSPSRPLRPIIEAVKRLSDRMPISLVLAGHGDLEADYRAAAEGCPNIHFAGWIDRLAMMGLFQVSDVLLAPYRPDYGFSLPTKIFDYLAAGKPMLSSCPGEAETLIKTSQCGVQYDFDDSGAIERALVMLQANRDLRLEMGTRARALFEQNYSIEEILDRYATFLECLATAPAHTA